MNFIYKPQVGLKAFFGFIDVISSSFFLFSPLKYFIHGFILWWALEFHSLSISFSLLIQTHTHIWYSRNFVCVPFIHFVWLNWIRERISAFDSRPSNHIEWSSWFTELSKKINKKNKWNLERKSYRTNKKEMKLNWNGVARVCKTKYDLFGGRKMIFLVENLFWLVVSTHRGAVAATQYPEKKLNWIEFQTIVSNWLWVSNVYNHHTWKFKCQFRWIQINSIRKCHLRSHGKWKQLLVMLQWNENLRYSFK